VILVLAEFLPKTLFRIDPNGVLRIFAIPLQVLYVLLWIPTMFMTGIAEVVLRLAGIQTQPGQTVFGRIDLDDFLKEMSSNSSRQSTMDAEVDYFRNTLELSNIKVRELMIPRAEVVAIDVEEPVSVLRDRLVETGLSKVLVYKDNIDDIIGYVHGYELFRHPKSIRSIIRPINIIPGTMAADDLLQTFIKQRNHVAVVVDEFGGTAGMLTIEDVVETIVGDIEDEHDVPEEVEERLGENEFLLSARSEVDHLRETHALAIPESEEYDTLAGFILHSTGDLPEQGQVIELPPFRITVAQVVHSRIDLVRLEVLDPDRGYLR
jgi:putative hemolysin